MDLGGGDLVRRVRGAMCIAMVAAPEAKAQPNAWCPRHKPNCHILPRNVHVVLSSWCEVGDGRY